MFLHCWLHLYVLESLTTIVVDISAKEKCFFFKLQMYFEISCMERYVWEQSF